MRKRRQLEKNESRSPRHQTNGGTMLRHTVVADATAQRAPPPTTQHTHIHKQTNKQTNKQETTKHCNFISNFYAKWLPPWALPSGYVFFQVFHLHYNKY